jgi:hypothetical protein
VTLDEPDLEKEREAIRRGNRLSIIIFAACVALLILAGIAALILILANME